jgi:hypothetical protein
MNLNHSIRVQTHHFLQRGLLALLLTGSLAASAQNTSKEQLVVALSSPGKPGSLHVRLVSGSISVVGYNGKEVVIDATVRESRSRSRERSQAETGGLRRIDNAEGFDLTAVEKDNRVTVNTDSWRRPIDLTIKVPQSFSLQIGTVQRGDIQIENVSGELEINNVNGSIKLSQVAGSALLNTVNGSLTASFTTVTPNAPMAFSTVNGKIDVTFPAKVKASLKLKTDMGAIYSDFDMDIAKAPKPATTSKGGVYRLSQDDWTYGNVNGGGAEIMMKSLQGNIYVRKAK